MRTTWPPALTRLTCISHSSHTTLPHSAPILAGHCQAARRLTTSSIRSWSLEDLPRVSQETNPLIFHLTSDNPYYNLSIEHYLLTHSHPDTRILLFYTNRPCVVIGRNQNPWLETDLKRLQQGLPPEDGRVPQTADKNYGPIHKTQLRKNGRAVPIDLVRRRSGGGTVFHDSGNLNYSVIIPNSKSFKRSTHADMVVRALSSASSRHQFADIRVNDRNDIVMRRETESQWLKVSGSAYKLTRGRALHHGTLLYSSPYLDKISELLRSPGRDFIEAKGVESVRSPVGNLVWTPDPGKRAEVRTGITQSIVREFWRMYGGDQERRAGFNEVTLGSAECAEDTNPEIASGVKELMSNAWRFEQTPRFDFASGTVDGKALTFQANRGVLEHLSLKSVSGGSVERAKSDFKEEIKLHDVKSWKGLNTGGNTNTNTQEQDGQIVPEASALARNSASSGGGGDVPDALVKRIEAIFPRYNV
ncbi:hypothetical protein LTS13_000389 [Exophiala xenobiotica]|nr:hypothetical protein LTR40_001127 [Exophiala xenobiotica]KAK5327766.1 hypothetical protein LTR93_003152 [Exophiala xenobiotica]KAK5348072.1 hypothetical protein LTR61_008324 [Exophiala xenobiotica]KAK5390308.1 hypothetical protein LTS13_000389 [Exophiala xenobiotica]KAK5403526.1 hypothetical protein LTR79_000279 [Exophiala xenobiotica]